MNRVVRKICGPERRDVTGVRESCIMRASCFLLPAKFSYGDQIRRIRWEGRGMYGAEDKCVQGCGEECEGKRPLVSCGEECEGKRPLVSCGEECEGRRPLVSCGEECEGRRPLVRQRQKWVDNIKMDLKEVEWKIGIGFIWLWSATSSRFL